MKKQHQSASRNAIVIKSPQAMACRLSLSLGDDAAINARGYDIGEQSENAAGPFIAENRSSIPHRRRNIQQKRQNAIEYQAVVFDDAFTRLCL